VLIDTHCHLASEEFRTDLPAVLERAKAAGVNKIICVASGDGFKSTYEAAKIAAKYENIWSTAGVHPLDATTPLDKKQLIKLADSPKVVAIGETGLDYFYTPETKDLQKAWLKTHIEVAITLNKPLIIHARESAQDCYEILKNMHAEAVGGVFHCYAEDAAFAEKLARINFMVSFTGVLTFKKSIALQTAAKQISLSQIMLETDSPYLAPTPFRGKRCEPAFVLETAKFLANLKNISLLELENITTKNAESFFKI